jgi:hypothetical protein
VVLAKINLIGDLVSTLVERRNFTGVFLPGYEKNA